MKTPIRPEFRPLLLVGFFQRWLVPVGWPPALAVLMFMALLPRGYALPEGALVVAGSVDIAQAGNVLNVAQNSRTAVVNWRGFNIGAGELVRVLQSGADAAMLARVTGGDPSQLLGQLKADGKLFLINSKGIVVGQGAIIDTAAFMASTLDVADADFLRGGALTFKGDASTGVVNLGKITAREGNVLLIAHTVKNAGEITASRGTAGLAAGTEVYLASPDAPTFVIRANLPAAAGQTGVENSGVIAAAQAELKAAGGSIYNLAVNQTGLVQATGVATRDGRVVLTADGGNVAVTGSAVARNANGSGGEILVGGDYRGGNASVANAGNAFVGAAAKLDASATAASADGGRVIVWADGGTRFLGSLEARAGRQGGNGGFAEVSGKRQLDFNPVAVADLSAPYGTRGTLLLDPGVLVVSAAADSNLSTSGTNPFVFSANTPSIVSVATLQSQLALTNVTLDTSTSGGPISFEAPVTWSAATTLRVQSGNGILLNADITGGTGSGLALYAGRPGHISSQEGSIDAEIELDENATVTVGTLTVGVNPFANLVDFVPSGDGAYHSLRGGLHLGSLVLDVTGGMSGLSARAGDNTIDRVATIGTGGLDQFGGLYVYDSAGGLEVDLALTNAEANEIEIVTNGNLTLNAGTAMTFANDADVVLAAIGGNFINNAGAGAIGANSRFLIYSAAPGGIVKNGLTGTEEMNRTFEGNPPWDYSGDRLSRFLYAATGGALPQLTYRAGNFSRYYGDANPAFSFTVSGEQPGLPVATNVTGAPAFSTTATVTSNAGLYTLNLTQGTLASTAYDFRFQPGTLTIEAAPIAFTVLNASRIYGDANPAFSLVATGLRNNDPLSAAGTFTFSTAATSTSDVGTYGISAGYIGYGNGNYAVGAITDGTLTINRAQLTVTAPTYARTYGQDTFVPLNDIRYTGLKNGLDALTSFNVSTAPTGSGIGTYGVTVGGTSTNYDVTFVPGTLTITPASLTIRANDVTRPYGDANPALTVTNTGLQNGETAAQAYSGLRLTTTATQASNVGTYTIVPSGAAGANYNIGFVNGTFTIERAILNVTVADATRTYSQANPAFSLAGITGLKNGETAGVLTGLSFSTVGSDALPGYNYAINATATAQNYSLNFTPGTLSVTKAPVVFAAGDATKVYGTTVPFPSFTLTGVRSEDEFQFRLMWQISNPDSIGLGVGTYPIDWPARFVASTMADYYRQFYDITFKPGTLTVTPAPLTLVARSGTAQYGTGLGTNGYEIFGLRNGDPASVISGTRLDTFSLFSNAAVGSYPVNFLAPGTAANYAITTVPGALTVTRRPLSVTAPSFTTYQGIVAPVPAITQPTLVSGGPRFSLVGYVPEGTRLAPVGTMLPVNLRIVPEGGATIEDITRSYNLSLIPGSLEILPRPVSNSIWGGIILDPSLLTMTGPTEIKLETDIKLEDIELETDFTIPESTIRIIDLKTPLRPADFASILTDSTDRFITYLQGAINSDVFKDLSDAQRRTLGRFLDGTLSPSELAAMMNSDPEVRAALMPAFGGYALELVTNGTSSFAERRMVHFMGEAAIAQRLALAAKVKENYKNWAEADARKSEVGVYGAYSMHLMPDIVSGAQTEVLNGLIGGAVGGAAAGGAAAATMVAASAVLTKAIFVNTALATSLAASSGGSVGSASAATAAGVAGPVAVVVGVAVLVTVVAITAIDASDKHRGAYNEILRRADEVTPKFGEPVFFELKPPQNGADRAEVMTSFLQVFGSAFGG